MKYTFADKKITGVAIPVSSLVSQKSCGIGEFFDLVLFADWCVAQNIQLIQILPVNDTGFDAGPYSAQSALALNPVYITLEKVLGSQSYLDAIDTFRTRQQSSQRVDYRSAYLFKTDILKKIYKDQKNTIVSEGNLQQFLDENSWLKTFAVYKHLKETNEQRSWVDWGEAAAPTSSFISDFFNQQKDHVFFYVWVQWLLDQQLQQAAIACEKKGVLLKGDIPILMNEDSADVWAQRQYFDLSFRAGAPPDMYAKDGQNWGFPVYNWQALAKDDYSWWRRRIAQANRYYHAFRIDHVLGFFRIWQIPTNEFSGLAGYFAPASYLTREELQEHGFDNARIRWLTQPHIAGHEIDNTLGDRGAKVRELYLERIENQELFLLKKELWSEKEIQDLHDDVDIKEFLRYWHHQRSLLPIGPDTFFPYWCHQDVYSYQSLDEDEKNRFSSLIKKHERQSNELWDKQARRLLAMMEQGHQMLVCAEDLGTVPDCLNGVLTDLNILALRVERWARDYDLPESPYFAVAQYPSLSVATSSVHDSSTLRGWWHENFDKAQYLAHIGADGSNDVELSTFLAEKILQHLATSNSMLLILPLQDFFALDDKSRLLSPDEERINVPGTVADTNWTYRMPMTIEQLLHEYTDLNRKVKTLAQRG